MKKLSWLAICFIVYSILFIAQLVMLHGFGIKPPYFLFNIQFIVFIVIIILIYVRFYKKGYKTKDEE